MRYTKNNDEALEVLNDGFVKIFRNIKVFTEPENSEYLLKMFMGWLKKIMINTGINHFKTFKKNTLPSTALNAAAIEHMAHNDSDQLVYNDLIKLIQNLSPGYRNTFCLYVIDGYKHEEIADILGISVGASKSNLLKARKNLKKMLETINA